MLEESPHDSHRLPFGQLLRTIFVASAVFWLPILLFLFLADLVHANPTLPGDVAVLQYIRHFSNPFLDTFFLSLTMLAGALFVVGFTSFVCAYLYKRGHPRFALFLLFSAAGTTIVNIIIKLLFQRSRPSLWQTIVVENGYSFPSGHAMISSALALSIVLLCWHTRYRLVSIIFGLLYVVLIGLSRLYLGVHYPTDVLAGWCVSVLWVTILYYIFGRFNRRS